MWPPEKECVSRVRQGIRHRFEGRRGTVRYQHMVHFHRMKRLEMLIEEPCDHAPGMVGSSGSVAVGQAMLCETKLDIPKSNRVK
jgi:hypothetical protein